MAVIGAIFLFDGFLNYLYYKDRIILLSANVIGSKQSYSNPSSIYAYGLNHIKLWFSPKHEILQEEEE